MSHPKHRFSPCRARASLAALSLLVLACGGAPAPSGEGPAEPAAQAEEAKPADAKPAEDAKQGAPAGALVATLGDARYGFEKRGEDWIFYDASAPAPAEHTPEMTVQALCDRRQSEGLLSEEGVFVSVTEVAVAGGETVTAKLSVTFDDTGHHSTPTATLSLDDKGQLVCRHEDNR